MFVCQKCGKLVKPRKPQHTLVTERYPQSAALNLRGQIKRELQVCSHCHPQVETDEDEHVQNQE